MQCFSSLYKYWKYFKLMYEVDKNLQKIHIINKFFSIKKENSMNMDEYLTKTKKTIDLLDDVNTPLLEAIIVWYTIKNLLKDYNMTK